MKVTYEVADVLQLEKHRLDDLCLTSWHSRTLYALSKCRTAALGGHIDKCDRCAHIHLSYNSCRNRHCPKCQGHKQELWVQKREEELLPVGYFHVVFTLPSELNTLCLKEPRVMYKTLFDASWDTLSAFATKELHAQMGMIAILHTWGQNLYLHPHLHCIVPAGGVSSFGKWKNAKSNGKYLFSVKAMSKVFRAKYVALLRKRLPKIPQDVYDLLFNKNWVVYAKPPFSKAHNVLEYLGRYTHKIAISNHRIQHIDKENRQVTFTAKDYRKGGVKKRLTLSFDEFIRRFALHILPKRFTRIRHYGILSSSWKKDKLPKLQQSLGLTKPTLQAKEKTILHKCPKCKIGTLVLVMNFDSRGPPIHVIPHQKLPLCN